MRTRTLGRSGLEVSAIGLGCMGMSYAYGPAGDRREMIALIRAAVDRGVTLFDTADIYDDGVSETILGQALHGHRDSVILATKVYYPMSDDPHDRGLSRQHIATSIDRSLARPLSETPTASSLGRKSDIALHGSVQAYTCIFGTIAVGSRSFAAAMPRTVPAVRSSRSPSWRRRTSRCCLRR